MMERIVKSLLLTILGILIFLIQSIYLVILPRIVGNGIDLNRQSQWPLYYQLVEMCLITVITNSKGDEF